MSDKRCDCCGARDGVADPLVAACDVLVLRALELVGARVIRSDRSRWARFGDRPKHEAHLVWQADEDQVERALEGAWTSVSLIVGEHGCCGVDSAEVVATLDRYVRDLVLTMTGHSALELRYRMTAYLGVPA